MKRIFYLLLLILMFDFAIAFAQSKIRFGIIYFYPPFVFSSKSGSIYGFDYDVAKAICQNLNAQCTFQPMPLSQLFTSLKQNKVDAIMGAISITPYRLSDIAFTRPYLKSTMSFVTLATNQIQPDNLNGRRVGVVKDSTFYTYLSKKYGNSIRLTAYTTNEELMNALSNKEVDLVLIDSPAANYWVNYSTGLFKVVGSPAFLDFDQGYGIGIKKDNPTLVNSLNSALNLIIQNGTLDRIKQFYFTNQQ